MGPPGQTITGVKRQLVIAADSLAVHATNTLGFVPWEGAQCAMKFTVEYESGPTNAVTQTWLLRRAASGGTTFSTVATINCSGDGATARFADSTTIAVSPQDRFVIVHTAGDTSGTRCRLLGLEL
jgi:hypothetical protein